MPRPQIFPRRIWCPTCKGGTDSNPCSTCGKWIDGPLDKYLSAKRSVDENEFKDSRKDVGTGA